MHRALLAVTLSGLFALPAFAGERSLSHKAIPHRSTRSAQRHLSAGNTLLARGVRAVERGTRALSARTSAFYLLQKLIFQHGHETVQFGGQSMSLRQAYRQAKREQRLTGKRAFKAFFRAAPVGGIAVGVWLATKEPVVMLLAGPFDAAATFMMAKMGAGASKEVRSAYAQARSKTLQSALDAQIKDVPRSALAYYGSVTE